MPTLGWWYGGQEPTTRGVPIWTKLIENMGGAYRARLEKDPLLVHSGLFLDTPSAFTNPTLGQTKENRTRYPLLQQAVEAFDGRCSCSVVHSKADAAVDFVIVIGHEKLTIELQRLLAPSGVKVVPLPKSGGVVDLDDAYRELAHSQQVRTYFYGEPALPSSLAGLSGSTVPLGLQLNPYSFQIPWDALHVLRVGEGNAAPTSALPLGSSHVLSPTRLTRVDPGGPAHVVRLLNTVLAIVRVDPEDRLETAKSKVKEEEGEKAEEEVKEEEIDEDEVPYREEIAQREVLGFVVITAIDTLKRKYTILSPSPGKLPSTVAIAGSIEWVDSA